MRAEPRSARGALVSLALGAAACATVATGAWRSTPLETETLAARVTTAHVDARGVLTVGVDLVNNAAQPVVVASRACTASPAGGRAIAPAAAPPVVLAPGASEELTLSFAAPATPWSRGAVFLTLALDTGYAHTHAPPLRIDWQ